MSGKGVTPVGPKDLVVGVPTRDHTGILSSVLELQNIGSMMGRMTHFMFGIGGNIPRSRNVVMENLRTATALNHCKYMLWWDTDILIPPSSRDAIIKMIRWAEQHPTPVAVTADYRMDNGQSMVMLERTVYNSPHPTPQQLEAMPNHAEIGMAGFGLCYLPIDQDYVWRADKVGEDVYYWLDHPDVRLFLDKRVKLYHRKLVTL